MDIDSLPILHSPSIQPSQKNTEQNTLKDILLKAIQIGGIWNSQDNELHDLPLLLDIQDKNLNHSYALVNYYANTTINNTANFQAT